MQKKIIFLGLSLSLLSVRLHVYGQQNGLSVNYYQQSCPNVLQIVCQQMQQILNEDITLAASLLRLHFHDCFVRGCDASVLLNSTPGNAAEKAAIPNLTLRGFQQIDQIKAAVEAECPGVVSCADIVALAAQYSVGQVGGPIYQVPLGRRDGVVSLAIEALENIPAPFFNFTQLSNNFALKNLTDTDLVVLSGAHTIGVAHCPAFSNRLYNFSSTNNVDPTLNAQYASQLQADCPPGDTTTEVPMDYITPQTFDVNYYLLVSQNRGLFQSDAALLTQSFTDAYVDSHTLFPSNIIFFANFETSILKMGQISPLTGTQGQIRKICSAVNP
ncbi:hypothetical protein M569_00850 [Genlisea aurea]|uniref:Peroxidase n=1 Tax=Genlisea aurea TaxID=192259 RepID=S8D937_9LAMI|nr:hypothetical protein M569_00850 [Genlisea aurea]